MGRHVTILPHAPLARLLKSRGVARVSATGVKALEEYLTGYGIDLAKKAHQFAEHAGRSTVLDVDVKLAAKK